MAAFIDIVEPGSEADGSVSVPTEDNGSEGGEPGTEEKVSGDQEYRSGEDANSIIAVIPIVERHVHRMKRPPDQVDWEDQVFVSRAVIAMDLLLGLSRVLLEEQQQADENGLILPKGAGY